MSFVITKRKDSAWKKMVIRQQVTDVIAYGQIKTTLAKAKELKKHVDHLITLAKKNTLAAKREILSIVLNNTKMDRQQILQKALTLAKKYTTKKGGYTRVLRLGNKQGDNTKVAICQLV